MSFGPIPSSHEGNPQVDHMTNLGTTRQTAKGTTQDYLAYSNAIPVQKMAAGTPPSEVVKAPDRTAVDSASSLFSRAKASAARPATDRCWLNVEAPTFEPDKRAGKCLPQPHPRRR